MHTLVLGRIGEVLDHVNSHFESRARARSRRERSTTGITIALARDAGTPDRAIARGVAERLHWPVYDHELLETLAARTGWSVHALENADERHSSWVQESFESFLCFPGVREEAFVHRLVELVQELGERGDCVIVGRGAGQILPMPTTLHVRLVAPWEERVATFARQRELSHYEARRQLDRIDRHRRDFVARHFGHDPNDPGLYALVLNSAQLTEGECVDLILDALRQRLVDRRQRAGA